jgi:flavin reductase (DIM6/NTAB) family NADH-FMN oxidoreductase RutF
MRIDPASLSPGRRYYLMISCIIPRPIAWVTTLNEDGCRNLAPFSFFNAFSATPPIIGIGFAPHEDKGEKDTLRNVRRSGEFSVSLATVELAPQVAASSEDLAYGSDEYAHAGLEAVASELIAPPRVAKSPVSLECVTWEIKPLGEAGSVLLLAEVKLLHIDEKLFNYYGVVDPYKFDALARLGGISYAGLGGERFDLQGGGG